jgi:hypothetical protein
VESFTASTTTTTTTTTTPTTSSSSTTTTSTNIIEKDAICSSRLYSTSPFFADISSKTSEPTEQSASRLRPRTVDGFDATPDALIAKARVIIATDFGIQDPSVLAEDFIWIRPLAEKPLGKVDYLAAGKFFDLRSVRSAHRFCFHETARKIFISSPSHTLKILLIITSCTVVSRPRL